MTKMILLRTTKSKIKNTKLKKMISRKNFKKENKCVNKC